MHVAKIYFHWVFLTSGSSSPAYEVIQYECRTSLCVYIDPSTVRVVIFYFILYLNFISMQLLIGNVDVAFIGVSIRIPFYRGSLLSSTSCITHRKVDTFDAYNRYGDRSNWIAHQMLDSLMGPTVYEI